MNSTEPPTCRRHQEEAASVRECRQSPLAPAGPGRQAQLRARAHLEHDDEAQQDEHDLQEVGVAVVHGAHHVGVVAVGGVGGHGQPDAAVLLQAQGTAGAGR